MKPTSLKHIFATVLLAATIATAQPAQAAELKRCPQYERMLKHHGLPVKQFSYIMWRESRCQPRAIGWNYKPGKTHRDCKLTPAATYRRCKAVRSYDIGLLQINSTWRSVTHEVCGTNDMLELQKPQCNLRVARYLYDNGGVDHWRGSGHP